MQTEAQRKANAKYKKKTKQILIRFYPRDEELYEKAKTLGSAKIKELILKA